MSKILCPYCSAPYTEEMLNVYEGSYGCDTGCSVINIEITCENCKKLVCKKNYDFGSIDDENDRKKIRKEEWETLRQEDLEVDR